MRTDDVAMALRRKNYLRWGMLDGIICFCHYLALLCCMLIISHLGFETSEGRRDR